MSSQLGWLAGMKRLACRTWCSSAIDRRKKAVKPAGKKWRRHPRTIRQENGWRYCTGWLVAKYKYEYISLQKNQQADQANRRFLWAPSRTLGGEKNLHKIGFVIYSAPL
jgi:hypothetical protein